MSKLRTISICIILSCSLICLWGQPNTFSNNKLPEIHEEIGNIDAAIKENLRLYYLNQPSEQNKLVPAKIANLFAQKGDFENSIRYYNIQYFDIPYGNPLKDSIRYEKIKVHLLAKEFKKAKIEVLQINKFKEENIDRYLFYKGLIYYFNNQYEEGIEILNQISYLNSTDKETLSKYRNKLIKNRKVNPKLHQIASGIIPGLGQYIAGDFKSGLNSTLLNGGFVYLFFVVGERLSYADAALSVAPWLMRYFIGGVGNARDAAISKKLKKKSKYITKTVELLQNSKNSLSLN